MRLWILVVITTGCGRIAFDTHDDGGSAAARCFAQVAAGRNHTCALDVGGNVFCWGWNNDGEVLAGGAAPMLTPTKIALPGPAAEVVAGRVFSCARLRDGTVDCWGDNSVGELGIGNTTPQLTPVEVQLGGDTALALGAETYGACVIRASDRAIACWGENQQYAIGAPMLDAAIATPIVLAGTQGAVGLAVGHRHGCALLATGETRCWGRNELGQGAEPPAGSHASADLANVTGATKIYAGGRHTCALDAAGAMTCWGKNAEGQLGNGAVSSGATAVPVATSETGVASLSLGAGSTCALHVDGKLDCWGDIEVGDGSLEIRRVPTPTGLTDIASVGVGYYHACAITRAGEVLCWGSNQYGELGRGTRSLSAIPIALGFNATSVAVGTAHTCALISPTEIRCWGNNTSGALGTGDRVTRASPVATLATGIGTVTGIEAGYFDTCAFKQGGQVACWGATAASRIAGLPDQLTPTIVPGIASAQHVGMGQLHTCAVDGTTLKCWGYNGDGELGDGTTTGSAVPVTVSGLVTPTDLCAGRNFTCALDGTSVKCWGMNSEGQLGDGTTNARNTPVLVTLPANATAVTCGTRHACARLSSGDVYCWGRNQAGELGVGDLGVHNTPTRTLLPGSATALKSGGGTSCVNVGTAEYCWGDGEVAQIPDGALASYSTAVSVPVLQGFGQIAFAESGGCGHMGTNGQVSCWGLTAILGNGDASYATPMPPLLTCPQ